MDHPAARLWPISALWVLTLVWGPTLLKCTPGREELGIDKPFLGLKGLSFDISFNKSK